MKQLDGVLSPDVRVQRLREGLVGSQGEHARAAVGILGSAGWAMTQLAHRIVVLDGANRFAVVVNDHESLQPLVRHRVLVVSLRDVRVSSGAWLPTSRMPYVDAAALQQRASACDAAGARLLTGCLR